MKLDLIKCAAVLAVALPVAASAADVPVGTVSAQLSELRYSLIDLDPDDGIAPTITFSSFNQARLFAEGNEQLTRYNPFNTEAGLHSVQSGGNTAVIQGNSLSASSAIQFGDVEFYPQSSLASGQNQASAGSKGWQEWTLSAQTALVIEGRAVATVDNDLTSLLSMTHHDIHSSSSANIDLYLAPQLDQSLASVFSRLVYESSHLGPSSGISTKSSEPSSLDEAFMLTVSNEGTTSMKGHLGFGVKAVTSMSVMTLASSVPEPSQWALMVLGLMGVAAARRRQQA